MKRIMVVANKWWEADPLCSVLIHDKARPAGFTDFAYPHFPAKRRQSVPAGAPRPADPKPEPRLTFTLNNAAVEVWCVEELMNAAENASSSAEKARVLPAAFAAGAAPDLVVAFGTAGSRPNVNINGCVVIGSQVLVHDPWPAGAGPTDRWVPPVRDAIIESRAGRTLLGKVPDENRLAAEARMIPVPIASASPLMIFAGDGFVSVGVVNVTNYGDYAWADASAVAAFAPANVAAVAAGKSGTQIGSVETTHGIIQSLASSHFLYISGITDAEGVFDFQVTPRVYAQNTAAAHNAAVALAWYLPGLIAAL